MSDIPDDIILEILLRQPVQSLCRFRCVSKPWRNLISDPEFVEKHLDFVKKHQPWKAMRYIVHYGRYALKSYSLFSLIHDPPGSSIDLYHPHKNPRHHVIIIASCNGLVCYCLQKANSADMFIWNPCTGEYKSCPFPFSVAIFYWSIFVHGFYYDRRTDDYIIVIVDGRIEKRRVEIYSVKTNSWRGIEYSDCHNICDGIVGGSGKLVNGALHWKGSRMLPSRRRGPTFVISLDLAESVFREVPQPNNYGYGFTSLHVQVIGESLSIFSDRCGHSVDVWIMKEYGVKESWTKLFSLPYTREMTSIRCYGAICTSKYILMRCNGNLALYDLDKKALTYPIIVDRFMSYKVTFFMETLVSPNVYG